MVRKAHRTALTAFSFAQLHASAPGFGKHVFLENGEIEPKGNQGSHSRSNRIRNRFLAPIHHTHDRRASHPLQLFTGNEFWLRDIQPSVEGIRMLKRLTPLQWGRIGGLLSRRKLSPTQRAESARHAANARWTRLRSQREGDATIRSRGAR
jgi:hypothetical protein